MPKAFARSIAAPQIDLHYLEYGNPEGAPVFLLHGFPDSPATWAKVVDRLDTKRLRLIVPYLRGTGKTLVRLTEHISGQGTALASDVLTLADALGLERFHLVGQDWGSTAAFATAALAPQRVAGILALASPYIQYGGKTEPPMQAHAFWYQWYFNTAHGAKVFAETTTNFCEALWKAWSPNWNFSKQDFAEAATAFNNPQFVAIVLHYYQHRYKTAPSLPPYAMGEAVLGVRPAITAPTIFAYGTADACNLPQSSEAQAAWFRGPYERIALKGVGHFPQREDPKAVARLIERLLQKSA